MGLVCFADHQVEVQMKRRSGYRDVVPRNELSAPAEGCEQLRPTLCDIPTELDERCTLDESLYAGALALGLSASSQFHSDKQLGENDGGNRDDIASMFLEEEIPSRISSLECDERARIDDYSQGFSGGLS